MLFIWVAAVLVPERMPRMPQDRKWWEAIRYAHLHGCRLYMTVNTLFKEKELEELRDYMKPYYEAGLDGVIVQDLGLFR